MSPELKELINVVDKSYYRSVDDSEGEMTSGRKAVSPLRHTYTGKRYEYTDYGQKSYYQSHKESKKKTYLTEKRDPVLDP